MGHDQRQILDLVEKGRLEIDAALDLLIQLKRQSCGHSLVHVPGTVPGEKESFGLVYFERFWEPTGPLLSNSMLSDRLKSGLVIIDCDSAESRPADDLALNDTTIGVKRGKGFRERGDSLYELDLSNEDDYERLFAALQNRGFLPGIILVVWRGDLAHDSICNDGLLTAFLLTRALMRQEVEGEVELVFLQHGHSGLAGSAAVSGFGKVAMQENGRLRFRTVHIEGDVPGLSSIVDIGLTELAHGGTDVEIKHDCKGRWVRRIREVALPPVSPANQPLDELILKKEGVYLITGGAGSLGLQFAKYFVEKFAASVVLMGRSSLFAANARAARSIESLGDRGVYLPGDVTNPQDVNRVVTQARERFGRITGVIHAAGVIEDALIVNKSLSSFQRVLVPKIVGAQLLDKATQNDHLDLFVLFSSVATVLSATGQSDYVAANRFLDNFAVERSAQVDRGIRHGHTVSLGWPLWERGGMSVTAIVQESLRKIAGVVVMPPAVGLTALETALRSRKPQLVAFYGDVQKLRDLAEKGIRPHFELPGDKNDGLTEEQMAMVKTTERFFIDLICREAKLPKHKLDTRQPLGGFGIDSILITKLNRCLEETFGPLPKSLFFEFPTIRDLALHFVTERANDLGPILEGGSRKNASGGERQPEASAVSRIAGLRRLARNTENDDIAVIGLSGRYPGASDLEQFWENLKAGKDCVTTIPSDRWDHQRYFNSDKSHQGTCYSRWGAFLDDIDKFDPLFFNIAPRSAEEMDPQERLFLEVAWSALEDAGYSRESLARTNRDGGENSVGVFVGVTLGQYPLLGADEWAKGNYITPYSAFWSIANRVSYVLNLNGPSMPVDTACSASLTAVHLACESIKRGECRAAIVGGVNLIIHPSKYVALSKARFLSSDGKCRSFGSGGDGYVPGEGVGAALLKPLSRAVADGDQIYAVIKATSINHGGRTHGYTVPSPKPQASLIARTLSKSGINPRSLGYVECHGAGTALGDPVEIDGLVKAFRQYTQDRQFCAIGSVKSNIGHLESAAGIASLTKVILMLRHRTLVPSLHVEALNENIDFAASPFIVQRDVAAWRPMHDPGARNRQELPRRAAISSFGAGGANAHLIIEEYPQLAAVTPDAGAHLVVVSAKDDERLHACAQRLGQFLARRQTAAADFMPLTLRDIAYTLQVGREHLESRLALLVDSVAELIAALAGYCEGSVHGHRMFSGRVTGDRTPDWDMTAADREIVKAQLRSGKWIEVAKEWVRGEEIPWDEHYRGENRRRVSLPTYPFQRKRFWISTAETDAVMSDREPDSPASPVATMHPLLDRVVRNSKGATFEKTFDKRDQLAQNHQVNGESIVPGVALLEMARAAAERLDIGNPDKLQGVVWLSPIVLGDQAQDVRLVLEETPSQWAFQVSTHGSTAETIHAKGFIALKPSSVLRDPPHVDLDALRARCSRRIEKHELYARLSRAGLNYGPYFQCQQVLYCNKTEALAELRLPSDCAGELAMYGLHPVLMDGALQAAGGLALLATIAPSEWQPLIPFSVDEVEILGPITPRCFAHATLLDTPADKDSGYYQVTILDEAGRSVVSLNRVCARRYRPSLQEPEPICERGASDVDYLYRPRWKEQPLSPLDGNLNLKDGAVVIFTHSDDFGMAARLATIHGVERTTVIQLDDANCGTGPAQISIDPRTPEDYRAALHNIGNLTTVYFLGGLQRKHYSANDLDFLQRSQEYGVFALLYLTQTLMQRADQSVRLRVITNNVHQVGDEDLGYNPFAGSLSGFSKALALEFPHLCVSCVDIAREDFEGKPDDALKRLVLALSRESGGTPVQEVAWRGERRFVNTMEHVILPAAAPQDLPIRKRGTYLIVGGLGGIGLTVAKYLARAFMARLVLVGRSALSDEKANAIKEIEVLGGEVLYLRADVCDPLSMRRVITLAKERFGQLDGAIHSAIVLRDRTIARMDRPTLAAVLDPKVRGMVVLHQVLEVEPLDFMAFFSSGISFTAAPGQSNYAAASTFEDCFAHFLQNRMKRPVKIFNWGFWGYSGIVATLEYREQLAARGVDPLRNEEGLEAFERVMASRATQIAPVKMTPELARIICPNPTKTHLPLPAMVPSMTRQVRERVDRFLAEQAPTLPGDNVLDELDQLGRLLLLRLFSVMRIWSGSERKYHPSALKEQLNILPTYARLFDALLDMLKKTGFVRVEDDGLMVAVNGRVLETTIRTDAIELRKRTLLKRYPDCLAYVNLLERCVAELPFVLSGRKSDTEVLFPGGNKSQVEQIYQGNRRADYFNELVCQLADVFTELRSRNTSHETIRILEVGAGTGATSARVLEQVARYRDRVDYDYTDISRAFLAAGDRTLRSRFQFVSFKLLDIEKDIATQGFAEGSYDLVIAANVLHATRDIHNAIHHVKRLLKTNGLLIVNEVTSVRDFITLTFGLTRGWWLFEDEPFRLPHSPLLSYRLWQLILEGAGFCQVTNLGAPRGELRDAGQCVILAESDGWLETHRTNPATPRLLGPEASPGNTPPQKSPAPSSKGTTKGRLAEFTCDYLRVVFAEKLKMAAEQIESEVPVEQYGVDSLVAIEVLARLEMEFGLLPKTLIFEQNTVGKLANYLLATNGPTIERILRTKSSAAEEPLNSKKRISTEAAPEKLLPASARERANAARPTDYDGIAVIGVSGRYPMADNVDAYWHLLKTGTTALTTMPPERLDDNSMPRADESNWGLPSHRWGGFVADVDKFDPLFFSISPREAERMDPHERLFLETAWATLEEAGYTPMALNRSAGALGVGVFVGVMHGHYQLLAAEQWALGNRVEAQSDYWSIANRVSYLFDFRGPSMAIDTACSSSLTAIHLACESIQRGECWAALVGGVNLILHPSHHAGLVKMGMLSGDGNCRAFGKGADGLVAGEGVGAVLLKRLNDAIRDRDHIYGVIKGTSINANGRTRGYMSPDSDAQADVIASALTRAGVDPRTISYVEAQAVGSATGDAIEVAGLANAFARYTSDKCFCAIGSVKPNIGHLEAASGVAQLTKVLLQFRHRQLAPSLNCEALNPLIDFENSPFYLQNHLGDWGIDNNCVRRAAISSFGAGGANAHLIIDEYAIAAAPAAIEPQDEATQVFILSARNPARLKEYASRIRNHLACFERDAESAGQSEAHALANLAYTLQIGRIAMSARLAVVARDIRSLLEDLDYFLEDRPSPSRLFFGTVKNNGQAATASIDPVGSPIAEFQPEELAAAWVRGADIDWAARHDCPCMRLSLPTYPFERQRYWIAQRRATRSSAPACPNGTEDMSSVSLGPVSHEGPDTGNKPQHGGATPEPRPEAKLEAAEPLPQSALEEHRDGPANGTVRDFVRHALATRLAEILKLKEVDVDFDEHLSGYGCDSMSLSQFTQRVQVDFGLEISPASLFEHSSLGSLADLMVEQHGHVFAEHLQQTAGRRTAIVPTPQADCQAAQRSSVFLNPSASSPIHQNDVASVAEPIAIIGMCGVFPGSPCLDVYWDNLIAGKDLISEVPPERFNWRSIYGDPRQDHSRVVSKCGGFLANVDQFDAPFFNISPREARLMDPQHRIFLQVAWKTIEDAGYRPLELAGTRTGIFVGVAATEYAQLIGQSGIEIDGQAATGNCHCMLTNRISYLLDLRGPSEPVDTACSSSLVAVHRAAAAIRSGECDLAIAGGVNLLLSAAGFLAFGKSGMLASDGKCKSFDQRADGYVRGEGAGAVVLKPLNRARADGDHIYAVIRGSAINHGGRANSLTAPNPNAQADVIIRAHQMAGIDPSTIGYIETHGTGTALGDPIEFNGLKYAFLELCRLRNARPKEFNYCGLGTVKPNIGHLETAAGIAGLIKVLLSMKHKKLPPLLHFQQLNKHIDLAETPFEVIDRARDWESFRGKDGRELPRRAGVSSFGFGGVNVHLVVEEFAEEDISAAESIPDKPEVFVLSAKREDRLAEYVRQFIGFLERHRDDEISMADLAYTVQVGRDAADARLAVIATQRDELLATLKDVADGHVDPKVAFLGNTKEHKDLVDILREDVSQTLFPQLAHTRDRGKLASLWVKGFNVDWKALIPQHKRRRLSLPTYPFAPESYWLPQPDPSSPVAAVSRPCISTAGSDTLPTQSPEMHSVISMAGAGQRDIAALATAERQSFAVLSQSNRLPTTRVTADRFVGSEAVCENSASEFAPVASLETRREEVYPRIRQLFAEFLGVSPQALGLDQDFPSCGVDSIAGLRIMQQIHRIYGDDIPMLAIIENPTLRKFVDYIVRNHLNDAPRSEGERSLETCVEHPAAEDIRPAVAAEAPTRLSTSFEKSLSAQTSPTGVSQQNGSPADGATGSKRKVAADDAETPQYSHATPCAGRLVAFRPRGRLVPLFGIHGESGDVGWLIHLVNHMGEEQPVYGVENAAIADEVAPGGTVEELAAAYAQTLLNVTASGPFRLAGHGVGGALAFETARQLQNRGHEVGELTLVGSYAPQSALVEFLAAKIDDPAFVLTCLGNTLANIWGTKKVLTYDCLPRDDFDAQLNRVALFLTNYSAPPISTAKLMQWLARSVRHYGVHINALNRYRPEIFQGPIRCALVQPRLEHLRTDNPYCLPAIATHMAEQTQLWQTLLPHNLLIREVSCDYFTIVSQESMRSIASHDLSTEGSTSQPLAGASRVEADSVKPFRNECNGMADEDQLRSPSTALVDNPVVVVINKKGCRRSSFWVHTLPGDVSYGVNLSRYLGREYPVYGLEQFGLKGRHHLISTVEQMAGYYRSAVQQIQPHGPYTLGGYSFGGIIAFEMACQLTKVGEEVADLVMIDSILPGTEIFAAIQAAIGKVGCGLGIDTDDFTLLALIIIANAFCDRWHADRNLTFDDIAGKDREAQIGSVARHLIEHTATKRSFEEVLHVIRTNCEVIISNNTTLLRYQPKYLEGRVNPVLFHASQGFVGPNNPNRIPEVQSPVSDRTNGFGNFIEAEMTIFDIPADHYTICRDEFLRVIVEKMKTAINGVEGHPVFTPLSNDRK